MLWEPAGDGRVRCKLCSYGCRIRDGKRGFCRVRENRGGTLYTLNYALASAIHADPIEKKPLYHFHPGTRVLSLGTLSCNFRCLHCQNYSLSQAAVEEGLPHLRECSPREAVALALERGCRGIAWTYNEPTIWFEYTYDSAREAKGASKDLYTVYVTNGYMTEEGLSTIEPYLDAYRVDVKAFTEAFYQEVSHARLQPVLERIESAVRKGLHVELVYLVIPTKNDGEGEIAQFTEWAADLDVNLPVHFTRFHPDYRLTHLPPTPLETLEKVREIARERLRYVYTGNVPGHEGENTYCHNCGELLIERWAYLIRRMDLPDDGRCPSCRTRIPIVR
jgi:pyruvate formate lyase activating enzyme